MIRALCVRKMQVDRGQIGVSHIYERKCVWEIWEHPIDTAQLETATAASVSCIRAHISEIGEIDAPGTWGQCKYYAYRGTYGEKTIGWKGVAEKRERARRMRARMGYRPSSLVSTTRGTEVLCRHLSALITGVLSRSIWECRRSARQIVSILSSSLFFFLLRVFLGGVTGCEKRARRYRCPQCVKYHSGSNFSTSSLSKHFNERVLWDASHTTKSPFPQYNRNNRQYQYISIR